MKTYLADTNIFLRFILKDDKELNKKAKEYFLLAKKKKVRIVLASQVVFEINYVLDSVYSLSKEKRIQTLSTLIKSTTIEVEERDILLTTIEKYKKLNVDLVDIYLYQKAKKKNINILSFDKDFTKIEKY